MEEIVIWLARDKNNALWSHIAKPNKGIRCWESSADTMNLDIPGILFPSVKWEDKEPTKAVIKLV